MANPLKIIFSGVSSIAILITLAIYEIVICPIINKWLEIDSIFGVFPEALNILKIMSSIAPVILAGITVIYMVMVSISSDSENVYLEEIGRL